jgi:peptide/nickel transport system substrate-binding protein
MQRGKRATRLLAVATGGSLLLAAAACGGGGAGSQTSGGRSDVFVFGLSSEPKILDGAYISDGESLRVTRQIYEGLVTNKPGTTEIVPQLAEKWDSEDSKTWTFTLKQGVKFHDGSDFNAEAVCANFERWYNFTGAQQNPAVGYYWQAVFGGFKKNEDKALGTSLYKSCTASSPTEAKIELSTPSSSFLSALSLPSFAMASPKALAQYGDDVSVQGENPTFTGKFGLEHPTGTGPYKFVSWQRGDRVTLERYDAYHGEKAKIKTLVFRAIPKGPDRLQALKNGSIDGYDQVDPPDVDSLKGEGFQVQERQALNVGWVGFTQNIPPLDNINIRKAIAHAINREALVKAQYPAGSVVAHSFTSPGIKGYNPNVVKYDYNPTKAKQFITDSGISNPEIELWYPTGVTRPYMPNPEANFQLIKKDLESVGFKVETKSARWTPEYLDAADNGKAMVHLLGWNADFADADNFVGVFFQDTNKRWGLTDSKIQGTLDKAEQEIDPAKREQLYVEANNLIMQNVPGVPYVHTKSYVGLGKPVKGFVTDPLSNETFAQVTKG